MSRTMSLAVVVLALVAPSCAAETTAGPPEVNYGRDICIECGMIIDDPRFAATYRTDEGAVMKFDDLGGLILHSRETGELSRADVWVSDFDLETFIQADSAFYVPTVGVASPMGHGILAFADRARAEDMASKLEGQVITWDVVVELPDIDGLVGGHGGEHGDDPRRDG